MPKPSERSNTSEQDSSATAKKLAGLKISFLDYKHKFGSTLKGFGPRINAYADCCVPYRAESQYSDLVVSS